jgi:hypothetical protein
MVDKWDRGPEPASPTPWTARDAWCVWPGESDEGALANVECADGCDGGCDDDPRAGELVQCRMLDHCEDVVCDVYGTESFAARDTATILHRVNDYPAACDEIDRLRTLLHSLTDMVREMAPLDPVAAEYHEMADAIEARIWCVEGPTRTPCRVHKGFVEDCGCEP